MELEAFESDEWDLCLKLDWEGEGAFDGDGFDGV